MLQVKELNKEFRNFRVLENVSINAQKGQIFGLVGSNGCGKTTLLKHIMKIYEQDSGKIYFDGKIVDEKSEVIKSFYYVQDDLFFPNADTLKSLFKYEALFYEKSSEEKYNRLVKFFNINENLRLNKMSKGQKKQAAFILAIATRPSVLLLDEIVDGLDAVVRRKFWSVLIQEVMQNQMTVIISSHALKELDNICDKIGIMHQGKVVKEENMEKLKEDITRIQFAIDGEFESIENQAFEILQTSKLGSVYILTIKGDVESFKKTLEKKYKVIIFDKLPMNLEEIFITELGGVGYGIEEYVSE